MSPSKYLPSVYTIRGLRAAQGYIFLDPRSAYAWLNQNIVGELPEHVQILPAEIIYYGGSLPAKTTEDMTNERHASSKTPI